MIDFPLLADEEQRACRLEDLQVLDTQAEPVLDAFTRLAKAVTGMPLALLNMVDRQRVFIKSAEGDVPQGASMPRGEAFCAWTIASDGILEVEDARLDDRFAHLNAVTGPLQAVHYVGAPLVFPGGERVGTICLIGQEPGRLQAHERKFLLGVADSIVEVLLLREREIRLKQEQLLSHAQSVAELSPVGLFALDAQGRIQHANAGWLRQWDFEPGASIATLDWLARIEAEDRARVEAGWRQALAGNQFWTDAFQVAPQDGKPRWLSMRMTPVAGQGSESAFVGAVADITHMKELALELAQAHSALRANQAQLSEALVEAQSANKAKSDFLATMSHELRTPLNAILGFAQVLEDSLEDLEQREQARYIRQTGETLTQILNDVLDVAKIEAGKLELDPRPFEIAQVVHNCIGTFQITAESKGLRFEYGMVKDLPLLIGDQVRLQQILHNLLSNAIKFTNAGSVRLYLAEDGRDQGDDGRQRLQVRLEVHDTGVGLTQEQMGRIFQRFEQAGPSTASRYGGTGLGLAIVQSLVHKMGGTVEVQSSFGKGSRFVLRIAFPLADTAAPRSEQHDVQTLEAPLDILVVDDFPINRAVLKALLAKRGHRVIEAEDGLKALSAVQLHRPQLVLMDVDMPVMDGLEATRRIRELDGALAGVPVYALTGKAFAEDMERTQAAGMQGHLSKPVQLKELVAVLKSVAGPLPA